MALRWILHADLDAFYASVEQMDRPELQGKPVVVGGSPEGRGVVAAASYEARAFGVRSAMPMARAVKLCPEAVILSPRFSIYRDYSKQVMDVLARESPIVEQVSIDEAYVELTSVVASAVEAESLAHRMQARIRVELALTASVGLASSKMVAKVACETGKPSGFVVVRAGEEEAFLADLAVEALPGIGPRSARKLRDNGFETLGQIAQAPMARLTSALGPWGALLQGRAAGEDRSAVKPERETKSVSAEETFPEDVSEGQPLRDELTRMAARVAGSLERHGLVARTVTLKLRTADFTTITRSASRERATAGAEAILTEALRLLDANWHEGEPLRLIGLGVSNLRPVQAPGQLTMDI